MFNSVIIVVVFLVVLLICTCSSGCSRNNATNEDEKALLSLSKNQAIPISDEDLIKAFSNGKVQLAIVPHIENFAGDYYYPLWLGNSGYPIDLYSSMYNWYPNVYFSPSKLYLRSRYRDFSPAQWVYSPGKNQFYYVNDI